VHWQGSDAASFSHEAGFDAWMTGACFARLLTLYQTIAAGKASEAGPGLAAVVPQAVATHLPPPLEAVASFSGRIALSRWALGCAFGPQRQGSRVKHRLWWKVTVSKFMKWPGQQAGRQAGAD